MLEFDVDKCYLSKDQVIDVGTKLIERWQADPKANFWLIRITKGVQFVLKHTPANHVEQYYREAFKMVYYMMQQNARAGDPTLQKLPEPEAPKPVYVVSEKKPSRLKLDFLSGLKEGGMRDN